MLSALSPWLAGFVALGVGYLAVGDSAWLFVFVVPTIAGVYVWRFGR